MGYGDSCGAKWFFFWVDFVVILEFFTPFFLCLHLFLQLQVTTSMNENYTKWDKFDVTEEEQLVEVRVKQEDRIRNFDKLEFEQTSIEADFVSKNLDDTESWNSKAAVDELRKRRKNRGKVKKSTPETETETESISSNPPPKTLPLTKAQSSKNRATSLQAAYDCRTKGKLLAKSGDFTSALEQFQAGMELVDLFERLTEEEQENLEEDEPNNDPNKPDNPSPNKKKSNNKNSRDLCCGPDAAYIKKQQQLIKPDPLRTTANNPKSLITTLRRDFNLNLGRAHLSTNNLSAAVDSLKYVLLVDGANVNGWIARGEAFRQMGVPLLADLHLVKATELDELDEDAKNMKLLTENDLEAKRRSKELGGLDEECDLSEIDIAMGAGKSAKDLLGESIFLHKNANVVFREQVSECNETGSKVFF